MRLYFLILTTMVFSMILLVIGAPTNTAEKDSTEEVEEEPKKLITTKVECRQPCTNRTDCQTHCGGRVSSDCCTTNCQSNCKRCDNTNCESRGGGGETKTNVKTGDTKVEAEAKTSIKINLEEVVDNHNEIHSPVIVNEKNVNEVTVSGGQNNCCCNKTKCGKDDEHKDEIVSEEEDITEEVLEPEPKLSLKKLNPTCCLIDVRKCNLSGNCRFVRKKFCGSLCEASDESLEQTNIAPSKIQDPPSVTERPIFDVKISGHEGYPEPQEYPGYTGHQEYPEYTVHQEYPEYTGHQEYPGYIGRQEYPGYQGYSGQQEYPGYPRYQGHPGYQVYPGYQGNTGYQGYPGHQGYSGYQ